MKPVKGRNINRIQESLPVFLWGSLWGIWEATAGHVVHLLRVPGLAGLVMFPAAFYFMSRAFAASGKYEVIFLTASVAAAIKLFDLLLPGQNVLAVVNPAWFILLESLAVIGVYSLLKFRPFPSRRDNRIDLIQS